jgi:NAD(P)-dependent dehydrogenase (short-subunit alcohol dehydrogenase family)
VTDASYGSDFRGKTIVVTGGGGGIGAEACLLFAMRGGRVIIVDVDAAGGARTASRVEAAGGIGEFLALDVTESGACAALVDRTTRLHASIDVLVNCAGIIRRANVMQTAEDEWDRVLSVNLKSVFLMCKHTIPIMRRQQGGKIVNVASGWGLAGGPLAAAYSASKGGVVLLTKSMAIDHGRDGINVNCVCPGDTNTSMLATEARQLGLTHDAILELGRTRPLGRVGEAGEIGEAILFLASSRAAFITGAVLAVDGGGLAGCG